MERYKKKFNESTTKNIDKVKRNIGDLIFNHIHGLNKSQLEKMLDSLKQELKLAQHLYGKDARYQSLKDEEWLILNRLERDSEYTD